MKLFACVVYVAMKDATMADGYKCEKPNADRLDKEKLFVKYKAYLTEKSPKRDLCRYKTSGSDVVRRYFAEKIPPRKLLDPKIINILHMTTENVNKICIVMRQMEKYALNLFHHPWKKEIKTIKVTN